VMLRVMGYVPAARSCRRALGPAQAVIDRRNPLVEAKWGKSCSSKPIYRSTSDLPEPFPLQSPSISPTCFRRLYRGL
jgi:hypothetical protein